MAYRPVRHIPYGRQSISRADQKAVAKALRSDFLTQGPGVERFEEALCRATGAHYAVAVANGTAALDLAVQAAIQYWGLPPRSKAITSPNTFVASSNAMLYNNLEPVFADIAPLSYNLSLKQLEQLLQAQSPSDPIQLVLPVHFAGEPIDMARLKALVDQFSPLSPRPIIEDAAHALGSYYASNDSAPVGSCRYSDMCCFSFHPVKTITCAEGGAITTQNPDLYHLLCQLRSHGIVRLPQQGPWQGSWQGPWYYEMQALGHNFRLSDIQAALGSSQLQRLETFARTRRKLAKHYTEALSGISWLRTPQISEGTCPHLYVVRIDFAHIGRTRTQVMEALQNQGIASQVHYIPVPMQPYYRGLGYSMEGLPECQRYYQEALSLPLFPAMKAREQQRVIRALRALAP